MSVPKVSVLMGVQNLEKYISQSIESVLTQTFTAVSYTHLIPYKLKAFKLI